MATTLSKQEAKKIIAKSKQKISTIVKDFGLRQIVIFEELGIARMYDNGKIPDGINPMFCHKLALTSDDPRSQFFSQYASNTGMLDFSGGITAKTNTFARKENTTGGAKIIMVEKETIINDTEMSLEVKGEQLKFAFQADASAVKYKAEYGMYLELKDLDLYKVSFNSVSQKRAGTLCMVPYDTNLRTLLVDGLRFNFASFTKVKKDMAIFNISKATKRPKLAASSGRKVELLQGFQFSKKTVEKFMNKIDGEEVESAVFTLLKMSRSGEMTDECIIVNHPQDFEVETEEEIITPQFNTMKDVSNLAELRRIAIKQTKRVFRRAATDGACFIDADWAKAHGLYQSVQFRFTPVVKGMLILVPGLFATTGKHIHLFEGSVKGNVDHYLENNELDFFVLQEARRVSKHGDSVLLARQAVGALTTENPQILTNLHNAGKDILTSAYNFEPDALAEFVATKDIDEEGNVSSVIKGDDNPEDFADETQEAEEKEVVLDTDNLTTARFMTAKEKFLKSASNCKQLADLIRASTGQIERGARYYVKDASVKHMTVDPFTIMMYLSQHIIGVKRAEETQEGIRRHHGIASAWLNDAYVIEHKRALLVRYPFLHLLEGQVINYDGLSAFNGEAARLYYEKEIAKKHFQGLMIYSLWDMVPEGQSGADFDGDTTVYITNPILADYITPKPLYLDYSLLGDDLVSGVPWKEDMVPSLEELVDLFGEKRSEQLYSMGCTYDKGVLTFPANLQGNIFVEECLADAMANIDAIMNTNSNIGRFTNINTSISELILMLQNIVATLAQYEDAKMVHARNVVQQELDGYNKLGFLMAAAIRWEIDKAKHGGAFMKHMPWLDLMIDGVKTPEELHVIEDEYDVSLERLFFGFKA